VDIIPAIKNHCRGNNREENRPSDALRPQAVAQQRHEQDQAEPKENGDESQPVFAVVVKIRRTGHASQEQRGVVQGGTVVLVGIVLVTALLPKLAELDGVHRLVIVHGTVIEPGQAQRQSHGSGQHQNGYLRTIHPRPKKTPNTKLQTPNSRKTPNIKSRTPPNRCALYHISAVQQFEFWNFSGVWCLVFGVLFPDPLAVAVAGIKAHLGRRPYTSISVYSFSALSVLPLE
jgi:hypothetical protein